MLNQFSRTELLIGEEGIEKLQNAKVAIYGVGGVGSFVAEGLARSGIGNMVLIDNDVVSISNLNRQIHANIETIGKKKVEVMKERILKINPNAKINIYNSTTREMKVMFNNHQLDILISHFPIFNSEDSNIYEKKILTCDSCFFGVKKYYDSFLISNKQNIVFDCPLLLPLKGFTTSNSLERIFKEHNLILSSNIYLYTTEMTVSLAKEGIGVGWALKNCITEELSNGNLYEIPLDIELPKMEFSVAYDKNTINKTALEFAKYLINEVKK